MAFEELKQRHAHVWGSALIETAKRLAADAGLVIEPEVGDAAPREYLLTLGTRR